MSVDAGSSRDRAAEPDSGKMSALPSPSAPTGEVVLHMSPQTNASAVSSVGAPRIAPLRPTSAGSIEADPPALPRRQSRRGRAGGSETKQMSENRSTQDVSRRSASRRDKHCAVRDTPPSSSSRRIAAHCLADDDSDDLTCCPDGCAERFDLYYIGLTLTSLVFIVLGLSFTFDSSTASSSGLFSIRHVRYGWHGTDSNVSNVQFSDEHSSAMEAAFAFTIFSGILACGALVSMATSMFTSRKRSLLYAAVLSSIATLFAFAPAITMVVVMYGTSYGKEGSVDTKGRLLYAGASLMLIASALLYFSAREASPISRRRRDDTGQGASRQNPTHKLRAGSAPVAVKLPRGTQYIVLQARGPAAGSGSSATATSSAPLDHARQLPHVSDASDGKSVAVETQADVTKAALETRIATAVRGRDFTQAAKLQDRLDALDDASMDDYNRAMLAIEQRIARLVELRQFVECVPLSKAEASLTELRTAYRHAADTQERERILAGMKEICQREGI